MTANKIARAAGTGAGVAVEYCQACGSEHLEAVLSLGYMPPVNQMVTIGQPPHQQPWFPTNLLHCRNCDLVQLGLAVDPAIIFPAEYPYTSGTTKLLRDNFANLHRESAALLNLDKDDLVIDIGSNDGTLLSNFKSGGHRVVGIEPTDVGDIANERGITTVKGYFGRELARDLTRDYGPASVVTAANCAHTVQESVRRMLDLEPRGEELAERLTLFRRDVVLSKLRLLTMLCQLKEKGARIVGISAPSRAATLINYVGLDESLIDYVCEIPGSLKIGKLMPGTGIPVVDEERLFSDQPDGALIFSWHIADELAPKLKAKGFRGQLITPLPTPRVL